MTLDPQTIKVKW